jgi:hypothetical protein
MISKYIAICKEIEHDRTVVPLFQELYAKKKKQKFALMAMALDGQWVNTNE